MSETGGCVVDAALETTNQEAAVQTMPAVVRPPLLDRLVTHRISMSEVAEAFALQETGSCGKVLMYPGASEPGHAKQGHRPEN